MHHAHMGAAQPLPLRNLHPLANMWKMQCDITIVILNFHKQFRLLATRKYFGAIVSAFASGIGLYIRLPGPGPGRSPCRGQGAGDHDIYNN